MARSPVTGKHRLTLPRRFLLTTRAVWRNIRGHNHRGIATAPFMTASPPHASAQPLHKAAAALLRDCARFAKGHSIRAVGLVAAGALCEGIGLALIVPLLGVVLSPETSNGGLSRAIATGFAALGIKTSIGQLTLLLGLFAAVMVLRAAVILARDVTLAELRIGFVEAQRLHVAESLAAASWDKVMRLQHARVVQAMGSEVQQIGAAIQFMTQSIAAAAMLLVQIALAFSIAPALALITCLLLMAGGFALLPLMQRARKLGWFVSTANQELIHGTAQYLGGLKLAISQNLQSGFLAVFCETLLAQRDRQIAYLRQQSTSRLAITTLSALVGAALVLVGLAVFHIAPTMLIALLLVVSRMSGPFGQIQQGGQMLANALPAYEKVQGLTAELAVTRDAEGSSQPSPPVDVPIRFEAVSFQHANTDDAKTSGIANLSLCIQPGTALGVCGPSGAGKTSFADLLAGLYPPQTGRILIGDTPLCGTALQNWRRVIAYVSQDPYLFHDTLRRNLSWASPEADETAMWQALATTEADDFVRALPLQLDTVVGERGTLMSGGERQRIALARAILRRPHLLIMDEATNAIDPACERRILDRLKAQSPRPTIVMIAHRKESLSVCENILTLQNGRQA